MSVRLKCYSIITNEKGGTSLVEILRCEHISKEYGSGNTCVKALNDVSFSVERGEFVSIIGP